MADERENAGQEVSLPEEYSWKKLVKLDGDALEIQYRHTLEELGKQGGMLGTIFRKAQNKIQDPAKLERLIKMIEKEAWSTLPVDVKGEIYEGLLERNAQDVKGGAGQYFTPRPLIEAMVEVMQPDVMDAVADPASGTGGFLLAAYDYMAAKALTKKEQKHLRESAVRGNDIVDSVTRLCAMNLYLHRIGSADGECPVVSQDALAKEVGDNDRVDRVLANPLFGKKSAITVINEKTGKAETEKLTYERADFWASTSNKQLNFVQHIANMLKIDDRATAKEPWTKQLWVYDYRTNVHKTLKQNRLVKSDFDEFVECFKPDDKSQRCESAEISRWKSFKYDELMPRDKTNLDIFWLKDDSLEDTENFPPPDVIAAEIVEHLEAALEEFRNVEDLLALSEASI